MKFFILFILLTFSLNSFSETTIQRSFGSSAICEIKGDMGKRIYKLDIESEKLTDDTREIALRVTFLKCSEVTGKLAITESFATEILHSTVLLPNGEIAYTSNTLLNARFTASDKLENVLGNAALDLNSDPTIISFSFDKNIDHAFIRSSLKSSVVLPTGEIMNDIFEYSNGFTLRFK